MKEKIIGKNLSPEKAAIFNREIKEEKEEGKKYFEGEFEKTAEDLKAIKVINLYIGQEFKEAEAKGKIEPILPEQIHYISTESYDKNFEEDAKMGSEAFYSVNKEAIYINAEAFYKMEKYYATLHEATHSTSFYKLRIKIDEEKINEEKITILLKCGYGTIANRIKIKLIENEVKKEDLFERFDGFNEAVTEKIAREISKKHKEEILKEFNVSDNEAVFPPIGYGNLLKILDTVIEKTAKKSGISKKEVWKKIKKGYFDGEMRHLWEIKNACGTDALRMLAIIEKNPNFASRFETNEMILTYFQTDDEAEKEKIASLILEKEKKKISNMYEKL